jgi:hypothetical protein
MLTIDLRQNRFYFRESTINIRIREIFWEDGRLSFLMYCLKGQSDEIFYSRFFIERLILVQIDMPKSDFEFCRIFVGVIRIQNNEKSTPRYHSFTAGS